MEFTSVFVQHARGYWDQGLSALPVTPGTKASHIPNWTAYQKPPGAKRRQEWLAQFPDHGIALLMGNDIGVGYRLAAIDIDDDRFVDPVLRLLDGVKVTKKGEKGLTIFVRVHESANLKSRSLKGPEGTNVIDFLFGGRMTVLPPTVHPNGNAYEWVANELLGTDLLELPELEGQGPRLGLIEDLVSSPHTLTLTAGEATHEAGLALSMTLVRNGYSEQEISSAIAACFPLDYKGDSLEELPGWIGSARDKVGLTPLDGEGDDDSQALLAMKLFEDLGLPLFIDQFGDCCTEVWRGESERKTVVKLTSHQFEYFIRKYFLDRHKKILAPNSLTACCAQLSAVAFHKRETRNVGLRVKNDGHRVVIDLGFEADTFVVIEPNRVEVGPQSPLPMRDYGSGGGSLPVPVLRKTPPSFAAIEQLRDILSLTEAALTKILSFILVSIHGQGPFPVLLLEGTQGTGKSFLSATIKKIVDPHILQKAALPKTVEELAAVVSNFYLAVFDNIGSIPNDISDQLCRIATGGGVGKRRLYTDDTLHVLDIMAPVILNGIAGVMYNSDLIERSIAVTLEPIPDEQKRPERQLEAEIGSLMPELLGELYWVVSRAMSLLPNTPVPVGPRMSDAAHFLAACETVLGWEEGTTREMLLGSQTSRILEASEGNPVYLALMEQLEGNEIFDGTIGKLHKRLKNSDYGHDKFFPPTPSALSKQLKKVLPALKARGVEIEWLGRSNNGQKIFIRLTNGDVSEDDS